MAPRINACGRMGNAEVAIKLFLCDKAEEKKIYEEAINQIEQKELEHQDAFVLCGENWHTGVIGIVSSKITDKYYRPSILIGFNNDNEVGKGSRKKYKRI